MIDTIMRQPHRVVVDTSGPEWRSGNKQEPQSKRGRRKKKSARVVEQTANQQTIVQMPLEMQPVLEAIRVYASTMRQCGSMDAVTVIYGMIEMLKNVENSANNPQIQEIIEWGQKKIIGIKQALASVYDGET